MPVPFGRLSLETTLCSKQPAPTIWRFRQVHMQHNYPIRYPYFSRRGQGQWIQDAGFWRRETGSIEIEYLSNGYCKIPSPVAFATASPRPWTPSLP